MKSRHPIELAVFVLLLLVFNFAGISPAASALSPSALREGELWRLLTYPWAHISLYHLVLDAAAFLCLYDMLRSNTSTRLLHLLSCVLFSGLVPVLLDPRLENIGLRGLSGVAHGLMVVTSLEALSSEAGSERAFGIVVLGGVIAKCAMELFTGTVLFASYHLGDVGIPVPTCHLGGALGGAFSYGWATFLRERARRVYTACNVVSSDFTSGVPYGKGSGTGANSATALNSREKSLFTSPDRQSVISPMRSGYLSVK